MSGGLVGFGALPPHVTTNQATHVELVDIWTVNDPHCFLSALCDKIELLLERGESTVFAASSPHLSICFRLAIELWT